MAAYVVYLKRRLEKMFTMRRFAQLIYQLYNTTRTSDKRAALRQFLEAADDAARIWLIALFTGRRPKRLVNTTLLRQWCAEAAGIPLWLFEESYHTVGDLAEAISLVLDTSNQAQEAAAQDKPLPEIMQQIRSLQTASEAEKKAFVLSQWQSLDQPSCLVFNKIIIGGFRSGVSGNMMVLAIADFLNKDPQEVAHLISGNWNPYQTSFQELLHSAATGADLSKPYPFYLAYALDVAHASLGAPQEWQAEWKWDGIRGQLIKRAGGLYLWSRGEDLVTDRFPEIAALQDVLPDGLVLDGEILAFREGKPLPFQFLQTRTTRKQVSKKDQEAAPVIFMAYDVLEWNGADVRNSSMEERRWLLEDLLRIIKHPVLVLSPTVAFESWEELGQLIGQSRERGCEGFMLKRKHSIYQAGRRRGDWWKWKIDPLSVDAVLIYAQKGSGKRSNLYTDYTFAVQDAAGHLVTFAKAYSGLTDKEIAAVDQFVRANSIEQFGPVRTVKPELVFEIGFEGIAASGRHKSGVAVRFPRILRWRQDKDVSEINTLDDLKELLQQYG